MRKRLFVVATLAVAIAVVFGIAAAQDGATVGPITQRILDRGNLICGVHPGLTGFGFVNDQGEYEGFDVDICRAVAAAILGDATAVEFVPLAADRRQEAIQTEAVDMISRNTTWTLTRDSNWGATFGPTTYYDGQGFAVTTASGITQFEELDALTVCVQSGTTTELNLADAFNFAGLTFSPQVFTEADPTWQAFTEGRCDAFTTDVSGIFAYIANSGAAGDYHVLRNEDGSPYQISKEPLGPLSPQSDAQFADIVRWTVYGLFQAEEDGITSANIDEFLSSEDPRVQRLLGQGENAIGSLFGIANDFMVTVIRQVGNYGEIFDRHLGPDTAFGLARGLNALWTDGGLMYAPPFR